VQTKCEGKDITVSRDILEYEMHNSSVYAKEEKLSLTGVAEILTNARTKSFTACFRTKVDEKDCTEQLQKASAAELTEGKKLAKQLLSGKETTIVGRLSNSEGRLGRSLVVDLTSKGYRQIDHRTLISLIINNVKYTVK
jgi:hypothetical protein